MKRWTVQDAQARFSEMLDACLAEGAQMVTSGGLETAVPVPLAEWKRLQQTARPTLKDLLLQPEGRFDMEIPPRGRFGRRPAPDFE